MLPQIVWTLLGLLMIAGTLVLGGWMFFRALKRSDDPPKLVVKWIVTLLAAGVAVFMLVGLEPGWGSAFVVPFMCAAVGILLGITWAPSLATLLARPLTSMYDGGMVEVKPGPLYSIAEGQRKKGHYQEALWEIQRQLDQYPNDFTGQMLMAEIQAEDLKDMQAAEATLARLCQQQGHSPPAIADALNRLADWKLKYEQDMEAARRVIQEIVDRFPGTSWSHMATQRLAHLGGADPLAAHERRPMHLPHIEDSPFPSRGPAAAPQKTSEDEAQALVKHLSEYPEDNEAREQLALIYARHYRRLDLAAEELEQLLAQPNAPSRQVVHWLNLLADLQLELAKDEAAARQTLQRIIDQFPEHAAAALAQQRQEHLQRELKRTEATKVVKLGTYDQDIGAKMHPPPHWGPPSS
jgi:TolA-binding protein